MDVEMDNDWKKKVGFPINYESGQSSDDDFDLKDVVVRNPRSSRYLLEESGDGSEADILGSTPPRSRIRDKEKRRNYMDSGVSLQRLIREKKDIVDNASSPELIERRKRSSLKLMRRKDRDIKLDQSQQNKADSLPSPNPMPAVPTLVESCNRFMSLTSRPKSRASCDKEAEEESWVSSDALPASRVNFHKTFSMLINMGNVDKGCRRTISREEQVWQNELKDLIWLELQAKIAGRTLAQQDAFLCAQRNVVPTVIKNICEYRFVNNNPCRRLSKRRAESQDSQENPADNQGDCSSPDLDEDDLVYGCLTFDCETCCAAIGRCMREVGTILDSFYNAVSLYPSSKAMTAEHPLIATPQFKNRLKAMCLWFNNALNMRLKIVSMMHLLRSIKNKGRRDKRTSVDSNISRQSSESHRSCQVRFNLSSNSNLTPTDSSNSDSSTAKDDDEKEKQDCQDKDSECSKQNGECAKDEDSSKDGVDCSREDGECAKDCGEKENGVEESRQEREDGSDSGVESMKLTGQTTPEIVIDSRYSTADTVTSQESGVAARGGGPGYSYGIDVYDIGSLEELSQLTLLNKASVSLYREHHQEILKTQGVRRCMAFINKMREHILQKVYLTLEKPDSVQTEPELEEVPVEVFRDPKEEETKTSPEEDVEEDESRTEELKRYGCWSEECRAMRLPSYRCHFLLLSSICMEATHDYLSFRLEAKPDRPCCLTVKQLIHELKEGLDIATEMRQDFVRNLRAALSGRAAGPAAPDLLLLVRTFDHTVETVLKLYLSYLTTMSEKEAMPRGSLQAEWRFTARLARRIKCAHHLAPRTFSTIVCNQLNRLLTSFNEKFAELKKEKEQNTEDPNRFSSHSVYAVCRAAQNIFACEREHTLQAAQGARALAARLQRAPPPAYLRQRQDIFNALMSIRDFIVKQVQFILRESARAFPERPGEVPEPVITRVRELLLQTCKLGFELHRELYNFGRDPVKLAEERSARRRRPASLQPAPRLDAPRRRRPDTVLVHESLNPLVIHKELHRFVNEPPVFPQRGGAGPRVSVTSPPRPPRGKFMRSDSVIDDYEANTLEDRLFDMNQFGDNQTQASIEIMLTGLEAPLEQQVEVRGGGGGGAVSAAERQWGARVARAVIQFAQCWMKFVLERCDTGRGLRPRWASQGLEFLMLACDPCNTKHLSEEEFEELKQLMDGCISHVIGSRQPAAEGVISSPSPRPRHRLHSPFSGNTSKDVPTPPTPPTEPDPVLAFNGPDSNGHRRRVLDSIQSLEESREAALREAKSVGRVVNSTVASYEPKLRQLTFKWQRGLKIGAGTFGKVYTVVNTESGQLLAMKELSIGANDRRAYQRAANELRVLEGVVHPHLVRYYGCELHREEMLLFMELCVEGSLEALVATSGALPEQTVRRYTRQLMSAVLALHARAIAHRDIKSGNIFLTNEGHCLKLGDFGCAVKIRANTTAPNELQGFVGTQAYMAPEVFMKSSGHGRAADIWSVGCVVTEMASGKRPFCEYDSNYQIMFRVGMGARPAAPPTLSEEGRQFCELCLTHEPAARPRAQDLMPHTFLMVNADEDCKCEPAYLIT